MTGENAWTGQSRGSPKEFKRGDGEVIQANGVSRPFDGPKLQRKPKPLRSPLGVVVIPEPDAPLVLGTKANQIYVGSLHSDSERPCGADNRAAEGCRDAIPSHHAKSI